MPFRKELNRQCASDSISVVIFYDTLMDLFFEHLLDVDHKRLNGLLDGVSFKFFCGRWMWRLTDGVAPQAVMGDPKKQDDPVTILVKQIDWSENTPCLLDSKNVFWHKLLILLMLGNMVRLVGSW